MRAFLEMLLDVTDDDEQRRKLADINYAVDDNDPDRAKTFQSAVVSLAALAADVPASFGGVTNASMVIIVADQEIGVRMNGIGAPLVLVRPTPALNGSSALSVIQKKDQPGLVIWRGKVTSLHFTNPSASSTARLFFALVGEAS